MSSWKIGVRGRTAVNYGSGRSTGAKNPRGARHFPSIGKLLMLAAMLVASLCLGMLSPMPPGVGARPISASTLSAALALPAPMRVISRGAPAYASSQRGGAASNANDNDYRTFWRSSGVPAWLAYDLSGVPIAQRGNVLLAWYNDPITPDYNYVLGKSSPYNLPSSYTIEANIAGGGQLPTSGWNLIATVTGNTYHSRQHTFNFAGYNWVRINVTGAEGAGQNRDAALNMDIHDISAGVQDSWIFYGDYISAGGTDHDPRGIGTFGQIINNLRADYYPAQESGGISYAQSGDGARLIRDWLAVFPGRYVALSYGTTDADFFPAGKPELPADFYKNYDLMVKAVLEAGKIPVVPKIPYAKTPKVQVNGPRLNEQIERLYAAYPEVIRGPDFWTFFEAHQELISNDGLNLTSAGLAEYRRLWALEMSEKVYKGARGACTGRLFPETGKCVNEPFLSYWNAHGQLPINGFPISDEFDEILEDGKSYKVQYFERVRMELHPGNQPPFNVLLGQFGRRIHPADAPVAPQPGATYFKETGHNLSGSFFDYWQANGGLAQFGYPISEEFSERLEDGKTYVVQYFERARFEHHPENQPPNDVLLGQFGRRILGGR